MVKIKEIRQDMLLFSLFLTNPLMTTREVLWRVLSPRWSHNAEGLPACGYTALHDGGRRVASSGIYSLPAHYTFHGSLFVYIAAYIVMAV